MDKLKKGEGCQQVQERELLQFDTRPAAGPRLDLRYNRAQVSRQTEIKLRAGNKVMRYQCKRRAAGRLPYGRRRGGTTQFCIITPDGNSETSSEPTIKQLKKYKRKSWQIAVGNHQGLEVRQLGLEQPSTSEAQCISASTAIYTGPCRCEIPCEPTGYPAPKQEEAAEQVGKRRKALSKRKNVEAEPQLSCLEEEEAAAAQRQKEAALRWAEEERRRSCREREACERRLAKERGYPLKRTYGDTRVNNRLSLSQGEGSEEAPSPQPEPQRAGACRPRGRERPARAAEKTRGRRGGGGGGGGPPLRRRRRHGHGVCLSDAQTQTESSSDNNNSCCCRRPGPSTSSSQGCDPGPGNGCAGCSSSQTSEGGSSSSSGNSSQGSSPASVARGGGGGSSSSHCSSRSSACPSPGQGQRAAGQSLSCELGGPPPPRTGRGGRRRNTAAAAARALTYTENAHRRRRATAKITACQPQHSQDNWGCLIF